MISDKELFSGLKSGDLNSIESIYNSMLPKVKKMILNNNGGADDAEDIFQETLEIILLKIDRIDSSFFGLVMRIAKNRWIDKLRRKKKINFVSLDDNIKREPRSADENLSDEYDKFLLMDMTFTQLGKLCQDLLTLVKKGESTENIVSQLSFNTANTMYRRKAACVEKWSSIIKQQNAYKVLYR